MFEGSCSTKGVGTGGAGAGADDAEGAVDDEAGGADEVVGADVISIKRAVDGAAIMILFSDAQQGP